jgi:hypothetical protein
MRSVRLLLIFALVLAIGLAVWTYIFAIRPLRNPHPAPMSARDVLAITGARIYVSPDAAPMAHGTVLLRDGKIAAVGQQV